MSADMQLNDDLLGEIGRHWPARALGLTCKRFGRLLNIASHIITRTEVDEWGSVVTTRRLPDGRLHGESTVAYEVGTIRRITSHLGLSTECVTSHYTSSPIIHARCSIYHGHEYIWQYGTLLTDATDPGPYVKIAQCALEECEAEIAKYALDRPHGDLISLVVASYSPVFMPDLVDGWS